MIWKRLQDRPFAIVYASYALLLCVILLIWIISFSRMMAIVEQDALSSVRGALNQGESTLNDNLTSIDRLATRTMSHPLIRSAMRMDSPLSDAGYNLLRRTNDEYSWMLAQEAFPMRFFIYFHSSESFVGDFGASARSKMIYDNYINYEDMTYEQWRERVSALGAHTTIWPSAKVSFSMANGVSSVISTERVLTFMYSVQDYGARVRHATIAALVSERAVKDCFASAHDMGALAIMLMSSDGGLLFTSAAMDDNASVDHEVVSAFINDGESVEYISQSGKRLILLRGENSAHGLISMAVIDYSAILARLEPLNRLFAMVFAAATIAGVILVILLSRLNNQPLRRIARLLQAMPQESATRTDGVPSLDMRINGIISVNTDLVSRLEASRTMLADMFQERLFLTGFDNEYELCRLAKLASFPCVSGAYITAVIQLDADDSEQANALEADERTRLRHIALERALDALPAPPTIHRAVGVNRVVAMFQRGDESNAFMRDNLNGLFPIWIGAARITGRVGVSASFERLADAHNAYIESDVALASLATAEQAQRTMAFYTELPITAFALYYPIDKEVQLMRLIRSGDAQGAVELLSQIYHQNYMVTPISEQMHRQLAHDLRSTFLRLIADVAAFTARDMKELYTAILDLHVHTDAEHQQKLFNETITTLCGIVNASQRDARGSYINNIIKYIEERCSDPELTLQSTADAFHLSQAYLSRYIREATGQTFSALVEERQMSTARGLVCETQLSIAQVAERCGYSSANTFLKAFKRVYGVSPSAMRKMEAIPTER